jgi:hypothetical protein
MPDRARTIHSTRVAAFAAAAMLVNSVAFGAASPGLTKIHESFVVAQIAADRCGPPDVETRKKFRANFEVVAIFARKELKARFPNSTDATVDAALKDQADKLARRVEEIVQTGGCQDERIQKLLEAYRHHAEWNSGAPPPRQ